MKATLKSDFNQTNDAFLNTYSICDLERVLSR